MLYAVAIAFYLCQEKLEMTGTHRAQAEAQILARANTFEPDELLRKLFLAAAIGP